MRIFNSVHALRKARAAEHPESRFVRATEATDAGTEDAVTAWPAHCLTTVKMDSSARGQAAVRIGRAHGPWQGQRFKLRAAAIALWAARARPTDPPASLILAHASSESRFNSGFREGDPSPSQTGLLRQLGLPLRGVLNRVLWIQPLDP
jgi:hypothetical protein